MIDEYWAAFFGIRPEEMGAAGIRVLPHRRLEGYRGAWVFQRAALTIVSAPEDLCTAVEARMNGLDGDPLSDGWIQAAFDGVERVLGPAYNGYVEGPSFRPAPPSGARMLAESEWDALRTLAGACSGEEWEHSGVRVDDLTVGGERVTFGLFAGGTLAAAAQYWPDGPHAARAGVITHPAHRGRGFATAVRSAATEHFLQGGGVMLYQTLLSNRPGVAVAEALGYRRYAVHRAVRFR